MKLFDDGNDHDAFFRMLHLWSEVCNYEQYNWSSNQLRNRIIDCFIAVWNVKEWFKASQSPLAGEVETFINSKEYLPIAIDIANKAKHRTLTRPARAGAQIAAFYGRVETKGGKGRDLYFISDQNGNHHEALSVLRGAIDEWEEFNHRVIEADIRRKRKS